MIKVKSTHVTREFIRQMKLLPTTNCHISTFHAFYSVYYLFSNQMLNGLQRFQIKATKPKSSSNERNESYSKVCANTIHMCKHILRQ